MNTLKGKITSIKNTQSLSLVTIQTGDVFFNTIVTETPDTATYLKTGGFITILFKATEVIIGKGPEHHISIPNKIMGTVLKIEKGELLCKIITDTMIGEISAILTLDAANHLQLEENDKITVMIKTTQIMLSQ